MHKRGRQNSSRSPKRDILTISLVSYLSAYDIIIKSFQIDYPGLSIKELMKKKMDFILYDDRKERPMKFASIIKQVKELGYYAFCIGEKSKKEIHFWISKDRRIKNHDIMELIMHEVIHAYGVSSEKAAMKYADIAGVAYKIVTKQMKDYLR